ncbi:LPD1 domain-containing protein [Mesobacillus zeae]|uniref:LPD1 domain-containing protein n=1 Tax=Mesobacillus zeae TaxID=1917180 RepID=UPI00300A7A6D
MDNNQLALFQVGEDNSFVLDIRTEQQSTKKVAYDVGEKIGHARKDLAALRKAFEEKQNASTLEDMENHSSVLAAQLINKNLLFKDFSFEKEQKKGTEPAVAKAKQLLIQRVDAQPEVDSKESRLKFMQAAQNLLSILEPIKVLDDFYSVVNHIASLIRAENNNPDYYSNRIREIKDELESLEKGSEDWKQLYKKGLRMKKLLSETEKEMEMGFNCLGKKFCNFFKSRNSYMSTMKNAIKIQSWEEILEKKGKKQPSKRGPIWERNLPERPDRIGGAQSPIEKPEDLISFFNFRACEFGHYVDDNKAFEHLLRSSEAMMDLADLLGIDYRAISLGGTLAMAYGARGRGGNANAHYEPFSNVINMTKERGSLGVWAHEWFHSFDSRLNRISHKFQNGNLGYATELDSWGPNIDPSLKLLFMELMALIKEGNSVGYYDNNNKPEDRWTIGSLTKQIYSRNDGELFSCMEEKVAMDRRSMERTLSMYSFYTPSDKEMEKLKKKSQKNIKAFATALAWYHEQQTGERVEKIPYPSEVSQYMQASIVLDKNKVGKYWSSNVELAARAFESFIQDKLKTSGRVSDYLVAGTFDGQAFPMGEERMAINKKFEEIFRFIIKLELL